MYADDAALLADTLLTLADKAKHIQAHLHNWGLSLSVSKTCALTTAAGQHEALQVEEAEGESSIQFARSLNILVPLFRFTATVILRSALDLIRPERRFGLLTLLFGLSLYAGCDMESHGY